MHRLCTSLLNTITATIETPHHTDDKTTPDMDADTDTDTHMTPALHRTAPSLHTLLNMLEYNTIDVREPVPAPACGGRGHGRGARRCGRYGDHPGHGWPGGELRVSYSSFVWTGLDSKLCSLLPCLAQRQLDGNGNGNGKGIVGLVGSGKQRQSSGCWRSLIRN